MRDPKERFLDILEAIKRIQRYAKTGKEAFMREELVQNWFIHHLQIIGEASRFIPEDIRERIPEIPWQKIIGMRHILVHNYFNLDIQAV